MLIQLQVRNFALIDDITLDFSKGLNVLTGTTGAGKSILIDALQLVLGERMDMSQVRDRSKPCLVHAVFSVTDKLRNLEPIQAYLTEEDDYLILKREISPEGRSRNEINGRLANVSDMKAVGSQCVDIHGQYDHQRIFDPVSHREFVDALAGFVVESQGKRTTKSIPLLPAYRELYERYAELMEKKQRLQDQQSGKERELDLLGFQIKEIEEVNPEEGEDISLEEERIRMAHSEKLYEITGRLLEVLDQSDQSASGQVSKTFRDWNDWEKIDESISKLKSQMDGLQGSLEEIIASIRNYQEGLSFEPERLKEVELRVDSLDKIKRKYGGNLKAALAFLEESKKRYDELANSEVYQKEVNQEIERLIPQLQKRADVVTQARRKAMESLAVSVQKDLKDLGFKHVQFQGKLSKVEFNENGQDHLEFMISPNAGEPLRPLALIASGGEASRIILAIKHTLAGVDKIPTLIFDEIDANVGGRLGQCVGQKLKAITKGHQVLLITHLPQIASFADCHYRVQKEVRKGKTYVGYEKLEGDERVKELAQMMSGEKETSISKVHAEEMLKAASK